jgi:hypothetical protein
VVKIQDNISIIVFRLLKWYQYLRPVLVTGSSNPTKMLSCIKFLGSPNTNFLSDQQHATTQSNVVCECGFSNYAGVAQSNHSFHLPYKFKNRPGESTNLQGSPPFMMLESGRIRLVRPSAVASVSPIKSECPAKL